MANDKRKDGPNQTMPVMEKNHIEDALMRTQGKIYGEDGAAELLDIKPTTLRSHIRKLDIRRKAFSKGGS